MDWSAHYPDLASLPESERTPKFLDVGCGFGGLLMDLSPKYPKKLMLGMFTFGLYIDVFIPRFSFHFSFLNVAGMEIRIQVTQFVADKILALRSQATEGSHSYNNISVLRANAMKFLPNFIPKHSLEKIFFLFPDPHFKARKHKARIISSTLLAEYAYILQPGGKLYAATDVEGLWNWMERHLDECELFRRIPNEREVDEVVEYVLGSTEEGKKVARNKGSKWVGVWERI